MGTWRAQVANTAPLPNLKSAKPLNISEYYLVTLVLTKIFEFYSWHGFLKSLPVPNIWKRLENWHDLVEGLNTLSQIDV